MITVDPVILLWLDLAGIFVFGLSGGALAVRHRLDVFGVLTLALAAALAGGVVRDVLISTRPAAVADERYLLAALAAGITAFFGHRTLDRLGKPVMILDALGLGLFAVAGCQKALAHGVGPLPAMLLGVMTAVGGGAVRDLLVAEVPRVLREEIYALAALVGTMVVVGAHLTGLPPLPSALTGAALASALRILSVVHGWNAPRAPWS